MTLRMMNDYVLIKTNETVKVSAGGIVLAGAVLEPPCVGEVVSVGEGKVLNNGTRMEHNIVPGDQVVFGKASLNQPLKDGDTTYYVMKIEEIFGKKN